MDQDFATHDGVRVPREDHGWAPAGSRPSDWKLPLDSTHIESALDMFAHAKDIPEDQKHAVAAKIVRYAEKHGVAQQKIDAFKERHLNASQAAEAPRLLFTLADFALGSAPRLPVAVTGQWVKLTETGKQVIKITLDDMHTMRANFAKKANGEVNVDYDHKSESGTEIAEPIPSAGRITELMEPEPFLDPQGVQRHVLWGAYEPTDRARQLIKAKEYRYTSPALGPGIDKATGKPQGMTLSSVALTNRPVIEQMPEVRLSDPSYRLMDAQSVHTDQNLSGSRSSESGEKTEPASAGKEKSMKNLKVKKLADGEHKGKFGVFDADEMVGLAELPDGWGPKDDKDTKEACDKASESARTTLLAEIGAVGKAPGEIKTLIERGATVNQEATLLSETVNEKGRVDVVKLDELVDSGAVKPSAMRRALAAETRVAEAFKAGKIRPTALQHATRLCLADEGAFQTFIENGKPVVDLTSQGVVRAAEDLKGAARMQLSEMIKKRMDESHETFELAELNVVRTKEGLALWNQVREEEMEKTK